MPDGSFKKLSVPPRLNDRLLDPLSVEDHAKYLYFHNRYRRVLETIQRKGGTERAVEKFGLSADWLRVVDHLTRRWSAEWAFAYIHHTFPAFDWPDNPDRGTLDPLTFAFLWFHGAAVPETFGAVRFQVSGEYPCPFCGRRIGRLDTVFRFGSPACGCRKRILRPTQAHVIVSDDFDRLDLVTSFRLRCLEQRVLDPVDYDRFPRRGMVFGFVGQRVGRVENELRESAERGLPTFIVGKEYASNSGKRRPVVGGLAVSGNAGQLE